MSYRFDDDRMMYATYSEGFRVGGSNPLRPTRSCRASQFRHAQELRDRLRRPSGSSNRLRLNFAAYSMDWTDFAVQIEDPQTPAGAVFQLGYVNLPTAEIQGVESEFSFAVNDAWQIDATLGWNDARGVRGHRAHADRDDGADVRDAQVDQRRATAADAGLDASLGIEWRSRGQLLNAQPFARVDLAYVGESVTSLEGFESVVGAGGVGHAGRLRDGRLPLGSRGRALERIAVCRQLLGRARDAVPEQSLGGAVGRRSSGRARTIGLQFRYDF